MSREVDATGVETLSEALGFVETVIEVGHSHPGVRRVLGAAGGTASFLVSLDDERISDLEVEIGIGHRGFEKEVESLPWHRALPYVARLGFAGGLIAEVGYCLAVEELAGVGIPDRAIWLRMLASEIARVSDHFARLAAVATAIGLASAESVAQQGEVEAARLLEAVTRRGPLVSWVRLGGVACAPAEGFTDRWRESHKKLNATLARFEAVAIDNPSCQQRLRDVAAFSVEDCIAWGLTGPVMRAAGLPMDVRRDTPYLAYAAVDFDVPVGENGDDLDRLLVVVEEIRQSLRIVDQCQELLASLGPSVVRLADPGWQELDAVDPLERAAIVLEGPMIPAGEVASSIESSTGELGFFLVSDGEGLPRRIRCRAASFLHAQAMPEMLRGAHLDDLLPTAAVLHLVSGECDR
jgi:NADH-quinone oxidoreductase subunit D